MLSNYIWETKYSTITQNSTGFFRGFFNLPIKLGILLLCSSHSQEIPEHLFFTFPVRVYCFQCSNFHFAPSHSFPRQITVSEESSFTERQTVTCLNLSMLYSMHFFPYFPFDEQLQETYMLNLKAEFCRTQLCSKFLHHPHDDTSIKEKGKQPKNETWNSKCNLCFAS